MMGTTPGSQLYDLWKTVGALEEESPIFRFPAMYTSELGEQRLTLWQDVDRTEREIIALSPGDKKEIAGCCGFAVQRKGYRFRRISRQS